MMNPKPPLRVAEGRAWRGNNMKSEWRTTVNLIGGIKVYGAYRLIDKDKTDHSGNREVRGLYATREEAEARAVQLNAEEEET